MIKNKFEPIIFDLDSSVAIPNVKSIDLKHFEKDLRYASSFKALLRFEESIRDFLLSFNIRFLGNGDFHHITYSLLKNLPQKNIKVVVFDNHPDNMIYPFGIHCGSWVYHASKLPNVAKIFVIGITSGDLKGINQVQNHISRIRNGRIEYYTFNKIPKLIKILGKGNIEKIDKADLTSLMEKILRENDNPIYLSIDKDVLSQNTLPSTWDQGIMTAEELFLCIKTIRSKVIAVDVVGDFSDFKFNIMSFKGILRKLDGNIEIRKDINKHTAFNKKLIELFTDTF